MAQKKVVAWFTMNGKHIPVFEGESKQDAINRSVAKANEDKKQADIAKSKAEAEQFDKAHRALTKGEKADARYKEETRRYKEGIHTKYGTEDHSKLYQHSEIQQMADEHVKKIWTRKGGVANAELYDAAKKFAQEKGIPEEKAYKAAFKAMNEKYLESNKLHDAGKDPLQGVKDREKARLNYKKGSLADDDVSYLGSAMILSQKQSSNISQKSKKEITAELRKKAKEIIIAKKGKVLNEDYNALREEGYNGTDIQNAFNYYEFSPTQAKFREQYGYGGANNTKKILTTKDSNGIKGLSAVVKKSKTAGSDGWSSFVPLYYSFDTNTVYTSPGEGRHLVTKLIRPNSAAEITETIEKWKRL